MVIIFCEVTKDIALAKAEPPLLEIQSWVLPTSGHVLPTHQYISTFAVYFCLKTLVFDIYYQFINAEVKTNIAVTHNQVQLT